MAWFGSTVICGFCVLCCLDQVSASCGFFASGSGNSGLGSTLMSFLLLQGLGGGGLQGIGRTGKTLPEVADGSPDDPMPTRSNPMVAQNPLLLPLLFLGGAGRMGGLGALGLPLLMGMGGGMGGGLAGLAPLALLGLSGMGGMGSSAIAPLALLGMGGLGGLGGFRPFGRRRVLDDKDKRSMAATASREIVNGTNKVAKDPSLGWSPVASANKLRRYVGYGFLWGPKRAALLKKVADDVQRDPHKRGPMAEKVWGTGSGTVETRANGTENE